MSYCLLAVSQACFRALPFFRDVVLTDFRVPDFPVMQNEKMTVTLKPTSFFELNPSNDVPRSSQQTNRSTLAQSFGGPVSSDPVAADGCCAPRL